MWKRLLIVTLLGACGSDSPADISGTYTMSLTVDQNQCGILQNSAGNTSSGVTVAITQSGSQATADVQGVAGALLNVALGKASFTGNVTGNSFDLAADGTRAGSNGTCSYKIRAHLVGNLSGDAIQGKVVYNYVTNHTSDCGSRDTCQDIQLFSGSRPPKT